MEPSVGRRQAKAGARTVLFVGTPPIDIQTAFDDTVSHTVDVDVAPTGRAAIARLIERSSPTAPIERPDLICIQFGFESPDGETLLRAIRSSPRLRSIPVVVFTPDEWHAETVSQHGGNAHVTIPASTEAYTDAIESLGRFWFNWPQQPAE